MNKKQILFFIFFIILVIIVYNLYKKCNNINNFIINDERVEIENFEDKKKYLKKNKNKNKNNNNNNNDNNTDNNNNNNNDTDNTDNTDNGKTILDFKKSIRKMKSKKTGTTFDDLFKATEKMDADKLSVENMNNNLSDYYNSFKKERFKNNSKNTAESFEKFAFYKEQFFNIFK